MTRDRRPIRHHDRAALLPRILEMQSAGLCASEVGRALGIANTTAAEIAAEAGRPFAKSKPGPRRIDREALLPRLLEMQAQGLTGSEAADRLGISQPMASEIARKAGHPFPRGRFQSRPKPARPRERVHRRPDLADHYARIREATHRLDYAALDALVGDVQSAWGPDHRLNPYAA